MLRELRGNISEMYDGKRCGSPYDFVDSPHPINQARILLNQVPIQERFINLSDIKEFEGPDRIVDADILAGLFVPVANALLAINPVGLAESVEALRKAIEIFETTARNLPALGEEDTNNKVDSEEDEYFAETEAASDDGMLFQMDDDEDCETSQDEAIHYPDSSVIDALRAGALEQARRVGAYTF